MYSFKQTLKNEFQSMDLQFTYFPMITILG